MAALGTQMLGQMVKAHVSPPGAAGLSKVELIPPADPGLSAYRHTEMCLPWRGLVV